MGAFDAIFARYEVGLLAFVRGLSGDHGAAEDITQECFVELARRIRRIDPEQGVSGWLYRVARNRTIDLLRRRKRVWLPGPPFFRRCAGREHDGKDAPRARMEQHEEAGHLQDLLDTLPHREKEVLAMHYFGDLTFREVAQALGRPLGTVLWQARRGLQRLRAAYGRQANEL